MRRGCKLYLSKNGTPLHTYGYASTGWKDLLTSFDGTAITYDAIGNPHNWRDGMTFTWGRPDGNWRAYRRAPPGQAILTAATGPDSPKP